MVASREQIIFLKKVLASVLAGSKNPINLVGEPEVKNQGRSCENGL
jgi:hypothetical protein